MKKALASISILAVLAVLAAAPVFAAEPYECFPDVVNDISPGEAYDMATTDPDVYILDVRTADEWIWVGHPDANKLGYGAELDGKVVNVSFKIVKKGAWVTNPSFVTDVAEIFENTGSTLITMCRSGNRSLAAQAKLRSAGYTVLNMCDGFEGQTDENGYRTVSGWKNDDLPYRITSPKDWDDAYPD